MTSFVDRPHHDGSPGYLSNPAPVLGEKVTVRLRVPHSAPAEAVWVRSNSDAEPHYEPARIDRSDEFATWFVAELELVNPVTRYRWLLSGGAGEYRWLAADGLHPHDVTDAFDFVLTTGAAAPEWATDAVVYQVFPDRFARSAAADERPAPEWALPAAWDDVVEHKPPVVDYQLFGGDLDGIAEHLDHLVDLGFNTLYLTPFFPARSIHRYDATTFRAVDPLLGGDEALARLTEAAHARGLRVIGDLTTNHTGVTHEWFRAAQADPSAPEREFYYFRPDGSHLGWYNVPTLPKLRWVPALFERFLVGPESVVQRWLLPPYNLDGWRIDVANMSGRQAADDWNLAIATGVRESAVQIRADALVVAEHCHDSGPDLTDGGWHGAMNYGGFLRPLWAWLRDPDYHREFLGLPVEVPRLPASSVPATVQRFQARMPWRALLASWSLICSHDTPRARTAMGAERAAVAAGVLFTFPGAPMVFMGDEWGGVGVNGEDSRRPMPWGRPELIDAGAASAYRALIGLRKETPALRVGSLRWVVAQDDLLVYVRETEDDLLVCQASRSAHGPVSVPRHALALTGGQRLVSLFGPDSAAATSDDAIHFSATGAQFSVWRSPR